MRLLYVAAMSRSIQGAAWVAALAALWAYALTLSPTVAWVNLGEDSGDLLAASATLGIPHPTGYPLFILLGRLATFLPLGTIAFRINLVAAVAAAASVYFVVRLACALAPEDARLLGALGAAACALLYASLAGRVEPERPLRGLHAERRVPGRRPVAPRRGRSRAGSSTVSCSRPISSASG